MRLLAIAFILVASCAGAQESQPARKPAPKQFVPPPTPQPEPVFVAPPTLPEPNEPDVRGLGGNVSGRVEESLLGRQHNPVDRPSTPGSAIGAIIGIVLFLVLAYLGGHRKVQEFERNLNIGHVTTTGLPFVLLGFVAARPELGVLTPSVLKEIAPLLPLGLGWIGFVIGSRFDAKSFERISPGSEAAVVLTTSVPIVLILASCSGLLLFLQPSLSDPGFLRDALMLGVAGAMAARNSVFFLGPLRVGEATSDRLVRIIELEQLAGVFGLMLISAYFRPQGAVVGWQLPGTAWLFVTLGIGTAMGLVIWAILTRIHNETQFSAVLLGGVAFTAGIASFLRLSAIPVCFIAGAIIVNLGGSWSQPFRAALERLERPVYFLFLVIAGALWLPWEWRGWALMAAFVLTRFLSKGLSALLVKRYWVTDLTPSERRVLAGAPMGALSVAMVVTAQDLYSGPTVPLIVTAVIGGTMLVEATLQIVRRRAAQEGAL